MGQREEPASLVGEDIDDGALVLRRMWTLVCHIVEEASERAITFVHAEDAAASEKAVAEGRGANPMSWNSAHAHARLLGRGVRSHRQPRLDLLLRSGLARRSHAAQRAYTIPGEE
jgi:hypothetical protein